MLEVIAPNPWPQDKFTGFLGGAGGDWRAVVKAALKDYDCLLLDPWRDDFPDQDDPAFVEQRDWEQKGQDLSDLRTYVFLSDSTASVSMMELAEHVDNPGVVLCEDAFENSGYVTALCEEHGMPVYTNVDEMIMYLKAKLDEAGVGKVAAKESALKTRCKTPEAQFHFKIDGDTVGMDVDLPEGIIEALSKEDAADLDATLHNAVELVLAPLFERQPKAAFLQKKHHAAPKDTLADPEFKAWFAGSKVTRNGKPLLVYHGSSEPFNEFTHTGRSIHFTERSSAARGYATGYRGDGHGVVHAAYLSIEKPIDLRKPGESERILGETGEWIDMDVVNDPEALGDIDLSLDGYDGIICDHEVGGGMQDGAVEYVVFGAGQIWKVDTEEVGKEIPEPEKTQSAQMELFASKKAAFLQKSSGLFPRLKRIITRDEAVKLRDAAMRAGKNGDVPTEAFTGNMPAGDYVEVEMPLSKVEVIHQDEAREKEYAEREGKFPPITVSYSARALKQESRVVYVADGLHRAAAAEMRGDSFIDAIMDMASWERFNTELYGGGPWKQVREKSAFLRKKANIPSFDEFVKEYKVPGHGLWDDQHYESVAWRMSEEDPEYFNLSDEEQSEAVTEELMGEIRARYQQLVYGYRNMTYPLGLYREVTLDGGIETLRLEDIGVYWTPDITKAEAYMGESKGNRFLLHTEAEEDQIDWKSTLRANIDLSTGEAEDEITLKKRVQLHAIGYRAVHGYNRSKRQYGDGSRWEWLEGKHLTAKKAGPALSINHDRMQQIWKDDAEAVAAAGPHTLPDGRTWVPWETTKNGTDYPVGTVRVNRSGSWAVVEEVPISKLKFQQAYRHPGGVEMHRDERGWEKVYPDVEKEGNKYLISDGHHRVDAAKASGVKKLKVWVRLPGGSGVYRDVLDSMGRDSAQIPKAVFGKAAFLLKADAGLTIEQIGSTEITIPGTDTRSRIKAMSYGEINFAYFAFKNERTPEALETAKQLALWGDQMDRGSNFKLPPAPQSAKPRYKFVTTCVGAEEQAILDMVDQSTEVPFKEFKKNCIGVEQAAKSLGYTSVAELTSDPVNSFSRSEYNGEPCYYMRQSGIEHVWTLEGRGRKKAAFLRKASAEPWQSSPYARYTELVPITELMKYREYNRLSPGEAKMDNPTNYIDKLVRSIEKEGLREALILEYSTEENKALLTEGNHRLLALKRMGRTHAPVRGARRRLGWGGKGVTMGQITWPPDKWGKEYIPAEFPPSMIGVGTGGAKTAAMQGDIQECAEAARAQIIGDRPARNGDCNEVAFALVETLAHHGVPSEAAFGYYHDISHMWVVAGDTYIDPTHDQFGSPSIRIGQISDDDYRQDYEDRRGLGWKKAAASGIPARRVIEYVAAHRGYIDDVTEEAILDFPEWEVRVVSLSAIQDVGEPRDPNLADEYANRKSPFPPVVLDTDMWPLDGQHRVTAARQRGDTSIAAYVPKTHSKAAFLQKKATHNRIYRRNTNSPTPDTGQGFTMWVAADALPGHEDGLDGYGKNKWQMTPAKTISALALRSLIQDKFLSDYEDGHLTPALEATLNAHGATPAENASAFLDEMNPRDIVESAGALDDRDFMAWLWDNYESLLIDTSITTEDGLVTFTHDAEAMPFQKTSKSGEVTV